MKLSLYEGTSRNRAILLMTGHRSAVLARKKERDISRRKNRNIKRWTEEVADDTPDYDKGKGGGPWTNYNGRLHGLHAAPRVSRHPLLKDPASAGCEAPESKNLPNTKNMQPNDIGYAVAALKAGKRVRRAGWNGKGMFLFLLPAGDGIPTKVIHDPALRAVIESEVGGETFDALGSVRMFTADKKVLTGWLASQSDLLAEDWEIID